MSLGPLMIDIAGTQLTTEDIHRLTHPLVGGLILFDRNYESPQQLRELTAHIKSLRQPTLQIAVDQEGGRVQRLRTGFTALPPLRAFGDLFDKDPSAACRHARYAGWLMATEIRSVGIDFSIAPVLDLDWGLSEIIGHRAFHKQADSVIQLASAYIDGLHSAGMIAIGKHFPGHGGVLADSHLGCVTDERSETELSAHDLRPFGALISEHLLDGVMTAHIRYPAVDQQIVTFSAVWIKQILRQKMGFKGLVLSDDLTMAGTGEESITTRANAALDAGCDILLVCNNPMAVDELLHQPEGSIRQKSRWFSMPTPMTTLAITANTRSELLKMKTGP